MRVTVLGGGVIGVTCAYYLARDGHEVTLVERQGDVALETSFANAGEISPGYSSPWAGPGVPLKAVKWLLMTHSPLVIRPLLDPAMWRFALAMLRNCTAARYALNKSRMVPLAEYSRDCLKALREETGITYDERTQGTLQLFRTAAQLDGIAKDTAVLSEYGVPFEVLDRAGFLAVEPGLAQSQHKFVGALRLPGDETGDCLLFTQRLALLAQGLGVKFLFDTTVTGLALGRGRLSAVQTSAGALDADRYVLALGSHSTPWLRKLGLNLPVYPVKGYSITVPIVNAACAPESTIMDESHKVAVTRLGDRIRVGGTAELAGFDESLHDRRKATLSYVLTDLFADGGDLSQMTFWCGLRPMTPDGTPVVGPTPVSNLLLATGHGTLGWTMATGTGRVIADMIAGRAPEIDASALGLSRYGGSWVG